MRWQEVAHAAGLVGADGRVRPTVFAEMSALAARTGAINLGQGFPDVDGPAHVVAAAQAALGAGRNQYAPGDGVPELRRAVADHQRRHYGLDWDPDTEVLVTTGATEAIAAAVLALVGPGDEVVALEPFYDAVGERTRVVLVNSPHNPTGAVLPAEDLAEIARLATAADAVVVTDEVYEHLVYDGAAHVPVATLPGMAERTLTVSSAGKTLSFTGWKVGWVTGPASLLTAVRTVKQYLTYTSGAPLQPAVAAALADDDGRVAAYVAELRASLERRRDLLCEGLRAAGLDVAVPAGTYFVLADGAPLGLDDGDRLARELPERVGVVAVPVSAFCRAGSPAATALRSWLRFTFVKREDVLHEALERLARLRA